MPSNRELDFLNAVLDNAGALVVVLDHDGRIRRFNKASEKLSGFSFAEVEGKYPWDILLPPEDADTIRRYAFEALARNPRAVAGRYTNRWVSRSGECYLIEWSNTLLCNSDGKMEFMVSLGTDVTERSRIEQQLQEQANIIDQIHDAVVATDLDGVVTSWNKGAERMFGYAANEMLGRPIACVYPPDQLAVLQHEVIAPLKAKGAHVAEVIMQRKNGERFNGHLALSLRYDAERRPVGMIGYTMDVTEQKRVEQALRRSETRLRENEERMRLVIEATDDGIWDWNPVTHEDYLSPRWKAILGYRDDELPNLDSTFFGLIHPDDRAGVSESVQRHFEEGAAYNMEVRMQHKDGGYRWIHSQGEALRDAKGRPVRMVGTITDITDRKRVDEELRQFKTTLDQTVDCVFMFDPATLRFFYANQGAINQVGYRTEELMSMTPVDLKPDFDESRFRGVIAPLLVGRSSSTYFETRHRHKDGHDVPVEIFLQYVAPAGEPPRFVAVVRDVTERKKVEGELAGHREHLEELVRDRTTALEAAKNEAERANAAKSEFLSRMSHELRTPMNAILGFAQILQLEPIGAEPVSFVDEIRRAGDHLLELINELLDLSRIEAGKMEVVLQAVPMFKAVNDSVQTVRTLLTQKNITLRNHCRDQAVVLADPTRLRQILLNLLSNAVKYNRDGGSIDIDCHPVDGERLRLSVSDTGPGIAPEKIAHLFTPFERLGAEFSAIDGTGIGLALARQLTELMGGIMGVDSSPGRGSTFWLELPVAQSTPIARTDDAVAAVHIAERRTVLYVEDNAANLRLVEAILRRYPNISLLSATNGEYGLELAKRYTPDAILLDIQLPGMDGYAVLAELRKDPATRMIPVLALSADALPLDVEKGLAAGFVHYLTKPVQVNQVMAALEAALPAPIAR